MIKINNNIYNQVKNWVENRSTKVISFSPIAIFKDIREDRFIITQYLEQLCDKDILQKQFYYNCKCGNEYIVKSLIDFPEYCEVCGEEINDPMHNSFLEYKIIRREN
ncbi:hypothetical protein ACFHWD_04300 [Clostridium sp. MT-14]|uniref:hypothetical protein n=1 Tax=Clostridium sp. MT-14 TaxID=3348360 RepID=UPI0035F455D8